jgi:hypothetical protein
VVPPLWEEIISTTDKLNIAERAPTNKWEVLRMPLWYNPLLRNAKNEVFGRDSSDLRLAKRVVTRIHHLWDDDKHDWNSLGGNVVANRIAGSVSQNWLNLLQSPFPSFSIGTWLRTKEERHPDHVHLVVDVTDPAHPTVDTYSLSATDHITSAKPIARESLQNVDELVPFHATFSVAAGGFIYEGMLHELELVPENVFLDQVDHDGVKSRVNVFKTTVGGTYRALVLIAVPVTCCLLVHRRGTTNWHRFSPIGSVFGGQCGTSTFNIPARKCSGRLPIDV